MLLLDFLIHPRSRRLVQNTAQSCKEMLANAWRIFFLLRRRKIGKAGAVAVDFQAHRTGSIHLALCRNFVNRGAHGGPRKIKRAVTFDVRLRQLWRWRRMASAGLKGLRRQAWNTRHTSQLLRTQTSSYSLSWTILAEPFAPSPFALTFAQHSAIDRAAPGIIAFSFGSIFCSRHDDEKSEERESSRSQSVECLSPLFSMLSRRRHSFSGRLLYCRSIPTGVIATLSTDRNIATSESVCVVLFRRRVPRRHESVLFEAGL